MSEDYFPEYEEVIYTEEDNLAEERIEGDEAEAWEIAFEEGEQLANDDLIKEWDKGDY